MEYINIIYKNYTKDQVKYWIEKEGIWYINKRIDDKGYRLIFYSHCNDYSVRDIDCILDEYNGDYKEITNKMLNTINAQQYGYPRNKMYIKLLRKTPMGYFPIFEGFVLDIF